MPDGEIIKIKEKFNIQEKDVIKWEFNKDSCITSSVEWIKVGELNSLDNDPYINYRVKTNSLILYEGKFVDMAYFYPGDIESLTPLPKDVAFSLYGCKGIKFYPPIKT